MAASAWRDEAPSMQGHGSPPGVMADIEAAYTERYAAFLRVASTIVGDPDLGRDAVQDGFARAIQRRRDFRGDGSLDGWLWRTVVNVARDVRRSRRNLTFTDELPERGVVGGDVWEDTLGDLRVGVAALPERQRLVLFLRYFADLSYAEIAEALEIRVGTVSATLNCAHRALRDAMPVAA
jgi:DNA-directed RNA polymerase specialized sigma24 family protein